MGTCGQPGAGGVGISDTSRAWMYQQGSGALVELTFESGERGAVATDVNASGVITGYEIDSGGVLHPGYWTTSGGAVLLTGDLDWTEALAVNDGGTIVGEYVYTSGGRALMWTAPEYAETRLPGLECDHCIDPGIDVNAINNSGTAVGSSTTAVYGSNGTDFAGTLAVEWQSGAVTSLGSLNSSNYSEAYAIAENGDVVGNSSTGEAATETHPGQFTHAFLYRQGAMSDLGTLSGDSDSTAYSINDRGQIVGQSQNNVANNGTTRAFLYQNGQMYDLNALIDPTSELAGVVKLESAVSINSNGWIAVNGTDSRDRLPHAFLLIPSE